MFMRSSEVIGFWLPKIKAQISSSPMNTSFTLLVKQSCLLCAVGEFYKLRQLRSGVSSTTGHSIYVWAIVVECSAWYAGYGGLWGLGSKGGVSELTKQQALGSPMPSECWDVGCAALTEWSCLAVTTRGFKPQT